MCAGRRAKPPPFPRPGVEDSRNEGRGRNGLGPVPSVEDLAGAVDPLGGVAAVLRRRVSAVGRAQSVEHCIVDLCRPIHRAVITGPARLALVVLRLVGGCLRWVAPSILGGWAEAAASLFCLLAVRPSGDTPGLCNTPILDWGRGSGGAGGAGPGTGAGWSGAVSASVEIAAALPSWRRPPASGCPGWSLRNVSRCASRGSNQRSRSRPSTETGELRDLTTRGGECCRCSSCFPGPDSIV